MGVGGGGWGLTEFPLISIIKDILRTVFALMDWAWTRYFGCYLEWPLLHLVEAFLQKIFWKSIIVTCTCLLSHLLLSHWWLFSTHECTIACKHVTASFVSSNICGFALWIQEIAWQRLDELQPASNDVISRGMTGLKLYMVSPFLSWVKCLSCKPGGCRCFFANDS